ncbi:hypothetical protein K438DRAFT_1860553 [Mycena galopus ATCC 62051]|nr:hypothetical protein K438DRAFT_1860553 [Mycena galopus ATCC 62051]
MLPRHLQYILTFALCRSFNFSTYTVGFLLRHRQSPTKMVQAAVDFVDGLESSERRRFFCYVMSPLSLFATTLHTSPMGMDGWWLTIMPIPFCYYFFMCLFHNNVNDLIPWCQSFVGFSLRPSSPD